MNRVARRILVASGLVTVLMAHRSIAQQGQISVNSNGVQQNYVMGPDGTYRVNDDGSLQQVDPGSEPALQGLSIPNNGQNGGGNNAGGRSVIRNGNNGGGVAMSGQQMQQKIQQATEDSVRKSMGSTDQEWTALLPLIRKIEALQSAVMPGSRLKVPPGGAELPASIAQLRASVEDFQKLLAIDSVSEVQLTQSLALVREARNKVKADLAEARKELTDVVTRRQEAILFERGILAD